MSKPLAPHEVIAALVTEFDRDSDEGLLSRLRALPPLADEEDRCWLSDSYWGEIAYPYVALADLAASRKLRSAIPLLLERASYGDPGEIMRGLRHALEAIVNPDWAVLAELCITAAGSSRPGTKLWAISQLVVLEDRRAERILLASIESEYEDIRDAAAMALARLQHPMAPT